MWVTGSYPGGPEMFISDALLMVFSLQIIQETKFQVIHELLCHPDIDLLAVDSNGMTAEKLACAHIKNILAVFK